MINGNAYKIVDIGMRMLTPRELFNAQGFPKDYIIDFTFEGKKITQTQQIAKCGSSVPPQFSESLVRANLPELCAKKRFETMEELFNYNPQMSQYNIFNQQYLKRDKE